MLLSDYQWSRNPRGLHVQRILITPLEFERWTRPGMGWVKLIASEFEYVDDSIRFLELGVTPILRPYRARWGAQPMDEGIRNQITAYAEAGVKWFELYNEPNLPEEWPWGYDPTWENVPDVIAPLMDNWLVFAEYVQSLGGYPGFPALAESASPRHGAVPWMNAFLDYMAQYRLDRFRNVLVRGMFCATHPYVLNHYYQEKPGEGPRSARQPEEQNGNEGGWHFEYPYDPISQGDDAGRTVFGGTALTPHGDPNGLLAMGLLFNFRCAELFGAQAIPVVGTEGGIWPFRHGRFQQDSRYPPYNEESQAEATVAMFRWISEVAPAWFFGLTLWKEDDYYFNGNHAPAIARLMEVPPIGRSVPALSVMNDGVGEVPLGPDGLPLIGPGPIQGEADYHMVLLAPGLDPAWFLDTAHAYWDAFRPMVTTRAELIDLIPHDTSLAVTLLTEPPMIETMTAAIRDRYRNIFFDLIVVTTTAEVGALFEGRAEAGKRFG